MTDRTRFSRILAGTDGSERAHEAVRQGARLASMLGGSLDVVFVMDTNRAHDRDVEDAAGDVLRRAAAVAAEQGVTAATRVLAGDAADALAEEVGSHGADLLCVGPDAGVLGGAIKIGQVAAHVLRHAPCSVLLAREAGPAFPTRIACGVDGSAGSTVTASVAASLAAAAGADLHVLHVVPVFRGRDAEWTLGPDEPSPPELEPSVAAAQALGVTPIRDMAMGRPEHALVAVAKRDGVDLLVVGHRDDGGVGRALLGSVSEYCALHAPCSVLVARMGMSGKPSG